MNAHEIVRKVISLGLPQGEYVVFGSCPLAIAGIREANDIDMLVSPGLIERFQGDGWKQIDKGPDDKPYTWDVFEVHPNWDFSPYSPTLDQLLATATVVDGVPFASLEEVRKWKVASGGKKHLADVKLIDQHLAIMTDMHSLSFGKLAFEPVSEHPELVAEPVRRLVESQGLSDVFVSQIDPTLADTAAFCEQYGIGLDVSANCVIVQARRADKTWYAACIILATTRADVNGVVRRHLDARKISFAPVDTAVSLSGMEYGGITPLGLPADWPILVDSRVAASDKVIVGSGIRGSKLLLPAKLLGELPNTVVMDITLS